MADTWNIRLKSLNLYKNRSMRNLLLFVFVGLMIYSCSSTGGPATQTHDPYDADTLSVGNDTVRIANDSLEYEILIIDPGFATFLASKALPEGHYSLNYLENKNQFLVADYNQRVDQPFNYNRNIYEQKINYSPNIEYGYEVNYKLYNYFVYLTYRYNQRFSVSTRL